MFDVHIIVCYIESILNKRKLTMQYIVTGNIDVGTLWQSRWSYREIGHLEYITMVYQENNFNIAKPFTLINKQLQ